MGQHVLMLNWQFKLINKLKFEVLIMIELFGRARTLTDIDDNSFFNGIFILTTITYNTPVVVIWDILM